MKYKSKFCIFFIFLMLYGCEDTLSRNETNVNKSNSNIIQVENSENISTNDTYDDTKAFDYLKDRILANQWSNVINSRYIMYFKRDYNLILLAKTDGEVFASLDYESIEYIPEDDALMFHVIRIDDTPISDAIDGKTNAREIDEYYKMTLTGDTLVVVVKDATDAQSTSEWIIID